MKRFEFAIFKGWWACKVDSTWPYVLVPFRNGAKLFHPHYLHLFHWNEFANGLVVFTGLKGEIIPAQHHLVKHSIYKNPFLRNSSSYTSENKVFSFSSHLLTFRAFSNFFFDSFTFRVCVILCWCFVTFAIHLFLFSIILDTKFQMFLSDRPRFNGNCYNRQVNTTLESILM